MLTRRTFLQGTLSTGAIALAVSSGLLIPGRILAAWNKEAFDATDLQTAIKSALGSDLTETSDKIEIKAPDIAENGAVVPVQVTSSLTNVSGITIFAENNGTPLSAKFNLGKDTAAFVSTRIKMGKTSNVIAVVTSGGKNYSARKEVKVTIGGCGG